MWGQTEIDNVNGSANDFAVLPHAVAVSGLHMQEKASFSHRCFVSLGKSSAGDCRRTEQASAMIGGSAEVNHTQSPFASFESRKTYFAAASRSNHDLCVSHGRMGPCEGNSSDLSSVLAVVRLYICSLTESLCVQSPRATSRALYAWQQAAANSFGP